MSLVAASPGCTGINAGITMWRILSGALLVGLLWCLAGSHCHAASGEASPAREMELFVSANCSHCQALHAFVRTLQQENPDLRVTSVDVRHDAAALGRLADLSRQAGIARPGVPSIRIGSQLIVGFDAPETTGAAIRAALAGAALPAQAPTPSAGSTCGIETEISCDPVVAESVRIPLIDRVIAPEALGLPLFTLMIGLLDGFNPCSMWVLVLMLSMLAPLRDRRKMLTLAGTFVVIQGLVYFAFMAAWLNAFLLIGASRISEIFIALLAVIAGALHMKDGLAPKLGPSLSIPVSARPGIFARMHAILRADRLAPALVGVVILGLLVQVVELLCTSGFPALYTRILTMRQIEPIRYYGYLMLYNAMYMLDDVVVLGVGVVTLSQRRLQEQEGRRLKFVAGIAMVGLGVYLLLRR